MGAVHPSFAVERPLVDAELAHNSRSCRRAAARCALPRAPTPHTLTGVAARLRRDRLAHSLLTAGGARAVRDVFVCLVHLRL